MGKQKTGRKMKLITLHLPPYILELLDELVKIGIFPSRSDAIRYALVSYLCEVRQILLIHPMIVGL